MRPVPHGVSSAGATPFAATPSAATGKATTRAGRRSSLVTAGHLIVGQLITGAASLAVNAMSARAMGPTGRGSFALLLQVTYLANLIAMAGTDKSYLATVPLGRSARGAAADALRLVIPPALLVSVAVAPVVYALGSGTPAGGLATVASCLFTGVTVLTAATVRTGATAAGILRPYVVSTVVGQASLVAMAMLLAMARIDTPQLWLLAYGVALGAGPAVAWVMLRRTPAADEPPHELGPARHLGLRLLPATVAGLVMLRADRLLLPWLGSYEQLGLYIVVATVAEFAIWPVISWTDAQSPRWHQRHLAGDLRRTGPLLLAAGYGVLAGLALLVAGRLLVVPVFGEEYRESVGLLVPLAVAAACYSISRVAIGLGLAAGRARGALIADVPAMAVALVAYLVLIPRYGALGAAVGSAVAYGVGAVLAVCACAREPRRTTSTAAHLFRTDDPRPVSSAPLD